MTVIAFIGSKGSGKSYAAKFLAETFTGEVHSFAGVLKEYLNELEIPCDRSNLIKHGNALQQIFSKHIFVQALAKRIAGLVETGQNIFIDDARFPQELLFLQKLGAQIVYLSVDDNVLYNRVCERGRQEDIIGYIPFVESLRSEYSEILATKIGENPDKFPELIILDNNQSLVDFEKTLIDLYFIGKNNGAQNAASTATVSANTNYS